MNNLTSTTATFNVSKVYADKGIKRVMVECGDDFHVEHKDGHLWFVRHQPNLPATIEECFTYMGMEYVERTNFSDTYDEVMYWYRILLICRDAYRRWDTETCLVNLKGRKEHYYCIVFDDKGTAIKKDTDDYSQLSFDIEYIRDEFLNCFSGIIERCIDVL